MSAMTTPTEPDGNGGIEASAPYLPPASPAATRGSTSLPVEPGPAVAPTVPTSDEAPFVPPPTPSSATPPVAEFDAKAMVESQRRINANPAYGALPTATEESRRATQELRAKAARKRRRNTMFGRLVAVGILAGIAAAGWFAYRAYVEDQNDESDAEVADRSASEILDDLGSQGEMINAQEALNDAVVPDAGGLLGAVDDARDVVANLDRGGSEGADAPTPFTYDVVVPAVVRDLGERLPDVAGRETYVISHADFAAGDPEAFGLFVRLMSDQPQLIPTADAFAGLPRVAPDEILMSVDRADDRVSRVIVVGESVDVRVDVTP